MMCELLEVSRSGFYEWRQHQNQSQSQDVLQLDRAIASVFCHHKARYGTRRIRAELHSRGILAGRYRIRRRMKVLGLKSIQPRSFVPKTTKTNPNLLRSPNLLLEMDAPDAVNQVWVGDITYLPLQNGAWCYLATWMDLFSRMIVGWKVGPSLQAPLVIDSLQKAIAKRKPKAGLMIHTDGGGQYMDKDFRNMLANHQFIQSMTRPNDHYDNAFAESLFSRCKAEELGKQPFKNHEHATDACFEFIEAYYNTQRRHSSIKYLSPSAFEQQIQQPKTVNELNPEKYR